MVDARTAPPERMDLFWRASCAALGLGLLVVALVLWFAPPKQSRFAPQSTGKSGIAKVDAPSETISVALLGFGVVLLIIGANGRKIATLKVGGNEVDWALQKAALKKTEEQLASIDVSSAVKSDALRLAPQLVYLDVKHGRDVDFDRIATEAIRTANVLHS